VAAIYRPNPAGIAAMLRQPFMVEALRRIAENGKQRAEQLTPVDTGRMKASWRVWAGIKNGKAAAQIFNVARNPKTGFPYPAALEFGTRYIRKRRILGRAIDSMRI
jgi:hypothetical protein